jgi:hypothetical protein
VRPHAQAAPVFAQSAVHVDATTDVDGISARVMDCVNARFLGRIDRFYERQVMGVRTSQGTFVPSAFLRLVLAYLS